MLGINTVINFTSNWFKRIQEMKKAKHHLRTLELNLMFGGFVAAMHKQEENSQSCPYRELFLVSSLPGFPGGLDSKEPACHAGDLASIPGTRRSLGEGNDNSFQYSCLKNPMNRGAW